MASILKEEFFANWDDDLSAVFKLVAPVLPEIRFRLGNNAAAAICEFSKNWRRHKREMRRVFDAGRRAEADAGQDNEVEAMSDENAQEEAGQINRKQEAQSSQHVTHEQTPHRIKYANIRPLSPLMRRRRTGVTSQPAGASRRQQRPRSSQSRRSVRSQGSSEDVRQSDASSCTPQQTEMFTREIKVRTRKQATKYHPAHMQNSVTSFSAP